MLDKKNSYVTLKEADEYFEAPRVPIDTESEPYKCAAVLVDKFLLSLHN